MGFRATLNFRKFDLPLKPSGKERLVFRRYVADIFVPNIFFKKFSLTEGSKIRFVLIFPIFMVRVMVQCSVTILMSLHAYFCHFRRKQNLVI